MVRVGACADELRLMGVMRVLSGLRGPGRTGGGEVSDARNISSARSPPRNGADVSRPLWGWCELYHVVGCEWRCLVFSSTLLCRKAFHVDVGLEMR